VEQLLWLRQMFELVAVVFVIGCLLALVEWWKGPDIPTS
jgi:hypothetical protein